MKILVISNFFPPNVLGGYEVGCAEIVSELAARGHQITVLTSQSRHDFLRHPDSKIKTSLRLWNVYGDGTPGSYTPETTRLYGKAIDTNNIAIILRELSSQQYDMVYCFNLFGLGALAICDMLQGLGIPWAWHLMDSIPSQMMDDMPANTVSFFQSLSTRRVSPHKVFVMSKCLQTEIESANVSLGENVIIVPGWAKDVPQPLRTEAASAGQTRFVSVGVLCQEKGTDLILQAIGELADEAGASITMDFFGRGNIHFYQMQAQKLGISKCVKFHGQVPHRTVLQALHGFDALLFPTWPREPFGFVAMEAAISGVLPVFTKGIGASEVLQDRLHAIHIDRDVESLKDAIVWVMENKDEASAIARSGQTFVRQNYTLAQMTDQVEAHLETIATGASISMTAAQRANDLARFKYSLVRQALSANRPSHAPKPMQADSKHELPSISDIYSSFKQVGRNAPGNIVIKWLRSGLLKLLRPYLFELLQQQRSARSDIDSIKLAVDMTHNAKETSQQANPGRLTEKH